MTTDITPTMRYWYILVGLLFLGLVGLAFTNYRFAKENAGGSDFLVHWVGSRALLIDGISPYSDRVAVRIQTLAYGRPARAGEHELRVAYPLYSTLIFAPFALIGDYPLARAAWMTFLELALVILTFLSLRLTNWHPSPWLLAVLLLFSLLWYHGLRAVINGNAVVLVALFLAGALAALQNQRDELAGVLFALATIKPHLVLLPLLLVAWWAISTRRLTVILWIMVTTIILTVMGMFFLPDWPLQNLREILRYPAYNPPGTPGAAFATWWPAAGPKLGWILSCLVVGLMIFEWYAVRGKDLRWLLWTFSLTLVLSQWSGIQTDAGNFILLFIPLILIFAIWQERWGMRSQWAVLVALLLLFGGLWGLFLNTVEYGYQPQQHPIMLFPLPFILLLGLYWVRWWAIKPQRLLIERLREREQNLSE
jgi:hypothetical protein